MGVAKAIRNSVQEGLHGAGARDVFSGSEMIATNREKSVDLGGMSVDIALVASLVQERGKLFGTREPILCGRSCKWPFHDRTLIWVRLCYNERSIVPSRHLLSLLHIWVSPREKGSQSSSVWALRDSDAGVIRHSVSDCVPSACRTLSLLAKSRARCPFHALGCVHTTPLSSDLGAFWD